MWDRATVFLTWVLTGAGQTVFARAFGNPSIRVDVPREGFPALFFARPGAKVFYYTEDSERFVKCQDE